MTAQLNLAPGSVIDGRYELSALLGEGGFAAVFEAFDRSIERTVAIKVLDVSSFPPDEELRQKLLDRFQREARMAGRIEHSGVVAIYDVGLIGEQERHPYIVMERLEGHDLEEQIFEYGTLSPQRALPLVIGALDALGEAHELGIVHKDLKPGNVFLVHPGDAHEALRLVDFGVAFMENAAEGRLTKTGEIPGTPNYLTPEYINEQIVTPALDVYQMALILVEMLSGQRMVTGTTIMRCLLTHISGELEVPKALVESELGPILKVALEKDHERRFAHGKAFANALRTIDPDVLPRLEAGEHEVVLLATRNPSPGTGDDQQPESQDSAETLFGLGEKEEMDTDRFLNEARQTGALSAKQTDRLFDLESAYDATTKQEQVSAQTDSGGNQSESTFSAVGPEIADEQGPQDGLEARAPSMWEFSGDAFEDEGAYTDRALPAEPEAEFQAPDSSRSTTLVVVLGLVLLLAVAGVVALVAWESTSDSSETSPEKAAVEETATEESSPDDEPAEKVKPEQAVRGLADEVGVGVASRAKRLATGASQEDDDKEAPTPTRDDEPADVESDDDPPEPTKSEPSRLAPSSKSPPSRPSKQKSLWVKVTSTPPKAFVTTEGKLVGLTPCKVKFEPGEQTQTIKFDKDGYVAMYLELRRGDYPSRSVTLEAEGGGASDPPGSAESRETYQADEDESVEDPEDSDRIRIAP